MGVDSPGWVSEVGNDLADTQHPGPGAVDDRDRGPRAFTGGGRGISGCAFA